MPRRYQVWDVFTDTALAGNPLAVVLDADGLDPERMQRIAAEFNLSETVFVLPADNPAHSGRVRIFTPGRELPFAGHPTVGTAVCLARERFGNGKHDAVVVLEEEVGPVRCGVTLDGAAGFAEFDCPRLPEIAGEVRLKDLLAAAVSLTPNEIGFENHAPSHWTAGVPYVFVPVRNMAVLAEARPNGATWAATFGTTGAFLYTRETEGHDHSFRARMFAPELGIAEDPATGSAAAAFAGVVKSFDALPEGTHPLVIEQGFEMGRPSLIRLEITVAAGAIAAVRVGGNAVRVAEGLLTA